MAAVRADIGEQVTEKAAITFWSADAFLTLADTTVYKKLTPELISRMSAFVDAYILFDKVCLPERYEKYSEMAGLGGRQVFEYVPSKALIHSDDLSKGITLDLNLASLALDKIAQEDRYWATQHNPEVFEAVYDHPSISTNTMSKMRLWLWSALEEVMELHEAAGLLPNSLIGIDKLARTPLQNEDYVSKDYILDLFAQFTQNWSNGLASVSRVIADPYLDTIKSFPPLLASLLDRANKREELVDVLRIMRDEYRELRTLRETFTEATTSATTAGEKRDVIREWDETWASLLASEFKQPSLLTRKFSVEEIVKIVFDPTNYLNMARFLLTEGLENYSEVRRYRHFKIFSRIAKDADLASFNMTDLRTKYGIEEIVKH